METIGTHILKPTRRLAVIPPKPRREASSGIPRGTYVRNTAPIPTARCLDRVSRKKFRGLGGVRGLGGLDQLGV